MAENDKPTAEETAQTRPAKAAEDDLSFTVGDWASTYYQALGVPAHVVAGAFHDLPAGREVSIKDARARVREWQRAEVAVTETPQEV
jgi:hypothetical protein